MYMRPNTLAPAPSLQSTQPPPLQPQQPPSSAGVHSHQRFYELLEALRMEYELTAQHNAGNGPDSGMNKMPLNDYESRGK